MLLTEPIEGAEARIIDAAQLGGTRHLSAAQFAAGPTRCMRSGRIAGRPVYAPRMVGLRWNGPRPPYRDAADVALRLWALLIPMPNSVLMNVQRCDWVNPADALMLRYHDCEWGVPVHDDRKHFEFLSAGSSAGRS